MKKILGFFLSGFILLGASGCSASTNPSVNAQPTPSATASSESTTDASSSSNTLVVYFSGTGNTRKIATEISEEINADIFELIPAEPYSNDDLNWRDENSRVTKEHNDSSLQDVALETDTVENWDAYDTVIIGYPIWWANAAWPVHAFIKNNDFTDKTVIPFAVSASSGLGDSAKILEEMAGNGNWQEGHRFSSNASKEEVSDWLKDLGLE